MDAPRTPDEGLQFLASRSPSTVVLGLERMHEALEELGHPELRLRIVQVGGTNGKGSTCAFLDAILRAAGYRVGLYTSPHLVRLNERIQVGGRPIDDRALGEGVVEVLGRSAAAAGATYFELGTLAALEHFAREQVDVAVLEVGLGGRLDATTAARPRLTALTRVGMDHMELLGETLEAIAREKAAIFRRGVPAVVAEQRPEVLAVAEAAASAVGAPLWVEGRDFSLDGLGRYQGLGLGVDGLALGLHGEHQHHNAAVAITCAQLLEQQGLSVGPEAVRAGLQRTRWPGRLEQVSGNPPLLLDGAHNEDGVLALRSALDAPPYAGRPMHLVFGVVRDKRVESLLRGLLPRCASVALTPVPTPRSLDPASVLDLARSLCPVAEVVASPGEGLERARRRAGSDGWVLVAGSLYLVGAVKALLEHTAPG
ncbi:MAG TPA: folylpolyglutamate synthase/dihydrofolate synthase family protein [Myxococcaceae bacterium]|nr:folylpolyglutamate synthase/dihydrofolate synthase family protein [Myxococcaceae bacterium]